MKKRIYLDFAASTPTDNRVVSVVSKSLSLLTGNASSLHYEGRLAKDALDGARKEIASLLAANATEIVFTSGGTEANNLAIKGIVKANPVDKPHVVTSSIEHSSVLEVMKGLEKEGVEVTYLKPNNEGIITSQSVQEALRKDTVLVSIMYANNEIGTVMPIRDIAKVIRQYRGLSKYPYLHIDAAQALDYLDMNTQRLGADIASIDSSKVYGPKGVGALYIKKGVKITPQMLGGGQEGGKRSGTENVPQILGFAKAISISEKLRSKEYARLTKLRDYFISRLERMGGVINGSKINRLPNNISVCFKRLDAEFAVYQLDEMGIAVSSASTCMNLKEDSYSYVVEEIGKDECKSSTLRFSLGRTTTKRDIDYCLKALEEVLLIQQWSISTNSK